jgi:hypothetical protein
VRSDPLSLSVALRLLVWEQAREQAREGAQQRARAWLTACWGHYAPLLRQQPASPPLDAAAQWLAALAAASAQVCTALTATHTHTREGGLTMVLRAGVYGGLERLSHGAYSYTSVVNGEETGDGCLERVPLRLGG